MDFIKNKKISIVGFGNQGFAWALNLKDSGVEPQIALRAGSKSIGKATDLGLEVINLKSAFINSDIICILTPDETHAELFNKYYGLMDEGQALVFAHGYSVHCEKLNLEGPNDIILVAPKGTGKSLRELYVNDFGVPALIAVGKDSTGNAWQIAKNMSEALGCHKAGVFKSTFREETEINLFSEQALYMSLLPEAVNETFDILTEAGYSKEASYIETVHKVSIMADILQRGLHNYYDKVSSIAKLGGILSKGKILAEGPKREMRKILKEIQDGSFVKKLKEEYDNKLESSSRHLESLKESEIENTGKRLREKFFKYER